MKTLNIKHTLAAIVAIAGLSMGSSAFAQLTTADDDVDNLALITFSVGGTNLELESSEAGNTTLGAGSGTETSFVVDRLIDFTVAEQNTDFNSTLAPIAGVGQNDVVMQFLISNDSNADLGFALHVEQNGGVANPFAAPGGSVVTLLTPEIWIEDGTTPGYQAAEDTQQAFIDILGEQASGANPDEQIVYVVADVPATGIVNTDFSLFTLVAQAAEPNTSGATHITNDDNGNISPGGTANDVVDTATTVEDVFGDAAGDGSFDFVGAGGFIAGDDTISNGQHSDTDGIEINGPSFTVTKTAETIWDPINANDNPKAIPGAYVRYTITVSNLAGASEGTLDDLTDTIPASLAFDTALLQTGCTDIDVTNCTDEDGNAYTVAGTLGVEVTFNDGGDTTVFVASGDAFSGQTLTINMDGDGVPADAILGTATGVSTGNTADGDVDGGQTVTIVFNAIIQ